MAGVQGGGGEDFLQHPKPIIFFPGTESATFNWALPLRYTPWEIGRFSESFNVPSVQDMVAPLTTYVMGSWIYWEVATLHEKTPGF